ncbi:uncharacterized protein LOC106652788 [Trichogramma pretiosum]|uniref:uncharacterized protein LOC106652788 n=1 Tax=Trichogramma pretiosum TaxID=7493 RepID=UPI000C71C3B6|nr:uncharacterized protein LOC106652788 [Trichogramma pretiosum]
MHLYHKSNMITLKLTFKSNSENLKKKIMQKRAREDSSLASDEYDMPYQSKMQSRYMAVQYKKAFHITNYSANTSFSLTISASLEESSKSKRQLNVEVTNHVEATMTNICDLPFHHVHGKSRTTNNGLATSWLRALGEFNNTIVIANQALRDGEMFEVVIENLELLERNRSRSQSPDSTHNEVIEILPSKRKESSPEKSDTGDNYTPKSYDSSQYRKKIETIKNKATTYKKHDAMEVYRHSNIPSQKGASRTKVDENKSRSKSYDSIAKKDDRIKEREIEKTREKNRHSNERSEKGASRTKVDENKSRSKSYDSTAKKDDRIKEREIEKTREKNRHSNERSEKGQKLPHISLKCHTFQPQVVYV